MYTALPHLWFCQCIGKPHGTKLHGVRLAVFLVRYLEFFFKEPAYKCMKVIIIKSLNSERDGVPVDLVFSTVFYQLSCSTKWFHKNKRTLQGTDNKRCCFLQTDNKSSLLKTGLTQNTVYEKGKLVPARTLTLMFQCPPYGRCFERYTK